MRSFLLFLSDDMRVVLGVSVSGFLFFLGVGLIIPDMPDLVRELSDENWKGFAFVFFSFAAILARPFAGMLIDNIGFVGAVVVGLFFSLVASVLYPFASSVFLIFVVRLVHGFSKGIVPTAMTGFIASVAPAKKRAKWLGHYSIATSLGVTLGPAIGAALSYEFGINFLFFIVIAVALVSVVIFFLQIEHFHGVANEGNHLATLRNDKRGFTFSVDRIKQVKVTVGDFFYRDVLPVSFVQMAFAFEFGVILTLIPSLHKSLSLVNLSPFFAVYAVSSIGIRVLTSSLSDRFGRVAVLVPTSIFYGIVVASFACIQSEYVLYAVGICYGVARGMTIPIMFAQLADQLPAKMKGKALSTFFVFLEIGTALGAAFGSFFSGDFIWFPFVVAGVFTIVAPFIFLIYSNREGVD